MRRSCIDCVRKHLGSAGIFVKETEMGYPDYDIWAVGELEHAADECLEYDKTIALLIREHRLAWTDDRTHRIPFEEINAYLKTCALADAGGLQHPEIPEGLTKGLDTSDAPFVVHGDTRPTGS